jgi:hypothetical protein
MIKRHILQLIVVLSVLFIPLYASIDSRIEAIQNAPVEERFRLMNLFKREVSQMNENARIDAITKLKSVTRSENSQKAIKELRHRTRQTYIKQVCKTNKNKERCERNTILRHQKYENEIDVDIENETEESIENETEESIENETEESIENETEESIENETEDHIESETEDHIEDEHDDDD